MARSIIILYDIPERAYPAAIDQSLKDKGFNAKFRALKETEKLPAIAIGLTDFRLWCIFG